MSPKPKENLRKKLVHFIFLSHICLQARFQKLALNIEGVKLFIIYKVFKNLKGILRCVIPTSHHKVAVLSSGSRVVRFAAVLKRAVRIILQSSQYP